MVEEKERERERERNIWRMRRFRWGGRKNNNAQEILARVRQ